MAVLLTAAATAGREAAWSAEAKVRRWEVPTTWRARELRRALEAVLEAMMNGGVERINGGNGAGGGA